MEKIGTETFIPWLAKFYCSSNEIVYFTVVITRAETKIRNVTNEYSNIRSFRWVSINPSFVEIYWGKSIFVAYNP